LVYYHVKVDDKGLWSFPNFFARYVSAFEVKIPDSYLEKCFFVPFLSPDLL